MKKKHGPDVWVVRTAGKYTIHVVPGLSQRAAIRFARQIAKANNSELFIQGRDGRIRARDSHGFDSPRRKG